MSSSTVSPIMRLALFLLTASWAATAVGLVDIPEVDEIVKEIKEEFSEYFQTPSPSEAAAPFRVNAIAAAAAATPADPSYWVKDVAHQGLAAFNSNPSAYQVFRNVKDFGAVGKPSSPSSSWKQTLLSNRDFLLQVMALRMILLLSMRPSARSASRTRQPSAVVLAHVIRPRLRLLLSTSLPARTRSALPL